VADCGRAASRRCCRLLGLDDRVTTLSTTSLVTANQVGKGDAPGVTIPALCRDRCRVESRTARGHELVVRDGGATWAFSSPRIEYTKGNDVLDIGGVTATGMRTMPHVGTPLSLEATEWSQIRRLEDEILDRQGTRRTCFVIEGTRPPMVVKAPEPRARIDRRRERSSGRVDVERGDLLHDVWWNRTGASVVHTVFTVDHDDFETYRIDGRRRFRMAPDRKGLRPPHV
jgi:hypothetical protein